MRPGPGLVVMALAFISGARRGSAIKGGSDWSSYKDSQEESLPKINPWLSACDLAQPSPDILQVLLVPTRCFFCLFVVPIKVPSTALTQNSPKEKKHFFIFAPPKGFLCSMKIFFDDVDVQITKKNPGHAIIE
jgi:hypothetical protein